MSAPRFRRPRRVLALALAASPLIPAAAQAQQSVTLEELSVVGAGGGPVADPRGAATPGVAAPVPAAPTPVAAPVGQVNSRIGRGDVIDDRPAVNIADVARNSPGVTVRQGNGPRDVIISVRGNNARATGVSRNFVVLEDGFPVTQADGSSRFDITDPRAYGSLDVFRGPQSALFGNYASGGALVFDTRRGAAVNGFEYGVDAGSFGYLNNYATVGGISGPFELSLFTSDSRGNGFAGHPRSTPRRSTSSARTRRRRTTASP